MNPAPRELRPARSVGDADMSNVSLSLIHSACPAVVQSAPDAFGSWGRLREAGRSLCAAVGINLQVWQQAQLELGPDAAISALAVTFQKTEDGMVLNPGAYLRALIQRGSRGELLVSRSLFALASVRGSTTKKEHGFPESGLIHYTRFVGIAREYAPKPTPDIDMLAQAFRIWAMQGHMDLHQPRIDKAFIGFCRKWRPK
jgi:replication initiation protein RepC